MAFPSSHSLKISNRPVTPASIYQHSRAFTHAAPITLSTSGNKRCYYWRSCILSLQLFRHSPSISTNSPVLPRSLYGHPSSRTQIYIQENFVLQWRASLRAYQGTKRPHRTSFFHGECNSPHQGDGFLVRGVPRPLQTLQTSAFSYMIISSRSHEKRRCHFSSTKLNRKGPWCWEVHSEHLPLWRILSQLYQVDKPILDIPIGLGGSDSLSPFAFSSHTWSIPVPDPDVGRLSSKEFFYISRPTRIWRRNGWITFQCLSISRKIVY